jgi:hypothetical protein
MAEEEVAANDVIVVCACIRRGLELRWKFQVWHQSAAVSTLAASTMWQEAQAQ